MRARYPSDVVPSKRVAVFYAAYFGVLGVVLPFLGPYLTWRGLGAVAVGLVTAAFSVAKLVYTPLVGGAVDRGRWLRGLLTGHCVVAVACAATVPFLTGAWQLGIALFAVGLGYGTVLPLIEAAVLERLPAVGYGPLRLWGSVGFVVVSSVAGVVVAARGIAWFPALLVALLAALALACLPLERAARPAARPHQGALPIAAWVLLALLTLHQVSHGPYYAFFSIHLEASGFSPQTISVLWSVGVLAELAMFLFGGRLEARLGQRRLLGLALAATPLRWLLLALPPSLPLLVVAQMGHALSFAAAHLAGVQLVQRVVPEGAARRVQALYSGLAFGLGIVVGTAAAGPVYAAWGGGGSFLAAAGVSVVVLAGWLALAPVFEGVRRSRS